MTTTFEPIAGHARPYTVVFFPTHPVTRDDLVRAGVAMDTAERIVSELGYLGTTSDLLVVAQEGQRLAFTSTWRRFARVREVVASSRKTDPAKVVLQRDNDINWVTSVQ